MTVIKQQIHNNLQDNTGKGGVLLSFCVVEDNWLTWMWLPDNNFTRVVLCGCGSVQQFRFTSGCITDLDTGYLCVRNPPVTSRHNCARHNGMLRLLLRCAQLATFLKANGERSSLVLVHALKSSSILRNYSSFVSFFQKFFQVN